MDRRYTERISGWAQVRIRHNDTEAIAVAMNLSKNGLCIECGMVYAKGDVLFLNLHLPDTVDLQLAARVSWVSKFGNHVPGLSYRYGLHIENIEKVQPELFARFFRNYTTGSFEGSRLSRIKVVVDGHQEMRGLQLHTLFNGGCYLLMSKGFPAVADELILLLHIPTSSEPASFRTGVVYVVGEDQANALGIDSGVGLQFLEMLKGSDRALVAYLGKDEPIFET